MKPSILLFVLLLSTPLLAQDLTNYVANTANANSPGTFNTLVGPQTGNPTMVGAYNVFIGDSAGNKNSTGVYNSFLGASAGSKNTGGGANTFIGYNAGQANLFGSENTFMGAGAGLYNQSGAENTFVGYRAGYNATTTNANTFIGYQAGYSTSSANSNVGNVFVGWKAGLSNTTGIANVFIGSEAGFNSTTGQGNMFLGQQAGGANTTGNYNLFVGNSSGSATTTGVGNTAVGDGSLLGNTTGQRNTAIGQYTGGNSRGDYNVFIGFVADVVPGNSEITHAVAIGPYAQVSQSNSIILGASNASVGIGNTSPTTKLHVTTGTANTSGLRLENLPISSTATGGQTKFLTVDGSGNVILGSLNGSAREGATDALWQRKGSFLQSTNGESIIIGQGVDKTPADYNLFVSKGILTEKVKVAVKNTSEWSDYVFKPGYALQPLAQVEQYIQTHAHLPGVPSAKEMVEQGNDLHKTDAKLLEKIEELTLYSIQLEKESQQQKIVNQHLQQNAKSQQAELDELKQLVKQLLDKR